MTASWDELVQYDEATLERENRSTISLKHPFTGRKQLTQWSFENELNMTVEVVLHKNKWYDIPLARAFVPPLKGLCMQLPSGRELELPDYVTVRPLGPYQEWPRVWTDKVMKGEPNVNGVCWHTASSAMGHIALTWVE